MAKTALVTGGTRGIGKAISETLKAKGYTVAANYGGNDGAAAEFFRETGIKVYKFDVADYDAVGAGLKAIEADLGPIEVLVNNAGITRDAPFHKMTLAQWQEVINVDLTSAFNVTRQVWDGMRERSWVSSTSMFFSKGSSASSMSVSTRGTMISRTMRLSSDSTPRIM